MIDDATYNALKADFEQLQKEQSMKRYTTVSYNKDGYRITTPIPENSPLMDYIHGDLADMVQTFERQKTVKGADALFDDTRPINTAYGNVGSIVIPGQSLAPQTMQPPVAAPVYQPAPTPVPAPQAAYTGLQGSGSTAIACPRCGNTRLEKIDGQFGAFYVCKNPGCMSGGKGLPVKKESFWLAQPNFAGKVCGACKSPLAVSDGKGEKSDKVYCSRNKRPPYPCHDQHVEVNGAMVKMPLELPATHFQL